MPYITTDEVKEKRNIIRKMFPKYKFSISRKNHSSININILSGPIELLEDATQWEQENGYQSINHFYIETNHKDFPAKVDLLSKIVDVASTDQRELVYDGDYGSVPTFYVNVSIGGFDKPYLVKN